ncbi:MAG: hypothetical protein G01um101466_212 [Parcubacteria group bacterium Gr01-1014_66]|nr:MAG: hypothetical protein G01um101466_212 [Parcubacteria group bacterium Gr01-1014_66]
MRYSFYFRKIFYSILPQRTPIRSHIHDRGIALLLIILIMTGILTISLSVFEVVFSNLLLTGEVTHSYYALYATDRIIEKLLYLEREPLLIYNAALSDFDLDLDAPAGKKAKIDYTVSTTGGTTIEVHARYPATENRSPVKRAFRVSY